MTNKGGWYGNIYDNDRRKDKGRKKPCQLSEISWSYRCPQR